MQVSECRTLDTQVVSGTFSTIVRVYDTDNPARCVERNVQHTEWLMLEGTYPGKACDTIRDELIRKWIAKYNPPAAASDTCASQTASSPVNMDEVKKILHALSDNFAQLSKALCK